jgi:hypothetical protein
MEVSPKNRPTSTKEPSADSDDTRLEKKTDFFSPPQFLNANECWMLKFRAAWSACEGNDIPNVTHAGNEHQQALEAHALARMTPTAVATQVHVPPDVFSWRNLFEFHWAGL